MIMKNLIIVLFAILLLSFLSKKQSNQIDEIPLIWSQFVGKDSTEHIYNFKKINGSVILKSITIVEKNNMSDIEKINSNYLEFDNLGKLNKVFVTNSVDVKNEQNQKVFSYNSDNVIFKENKINSISISNKFKTILNLYKIGDFFVQNELNGLDYPVYNFKNNQSINVKKIGKGVNPNLNASDYLNSIKSGIYKPYR
jgi:hypothetical protein